MYFDTLTVAENLIEAGMPEVQAKAIAREHANFMQHRVDEFSTTHDINRLREHLDTKFKELNAKIHELNTRIIRLA